MSDESLKESGVMSGCCSAAVYANIGICYDCKEPCEEIQEVEED